MQFIALSLSALLGLVATIATVSIDPAASNVHWKGYKVTGAHEGDINIKSGNLTFDGDKLTGGQFVIDMGTITVTDLTGEYADKLKGHLASDDFFGVASHPEAKLVITKVKPGKAGKYAVTGDLTIKETTKPITFDATVYQVDGKRIATADITIDRSKYDVRYGSGSFFDNLGDKTIYDDFDLNVKLVSK